MGIKKYKVSPSQLQLVVQQASNKPDAKLHQRLAFYLRNASVSFKRIAQSINRDEETISRWVAGITTPDAMDVLALCKVLGIEPNELLGLQPEAITPTITRREDEYLQLLTMNGAVKPVVLDAIANKINDNNNGTASNLEYVLKNSAELIRQLLALKAGLHDYS